jgi:penicillin-binding protein 2
MPVFNQSRSRIIKLIFSVAFLVILAQLFNLQVISGKYQELARSNAVYPKIVYPERGIIFDRKGKAILNNSIMYDLMVTPVEIKGIDTMDFCRMMEIDTAEFNRRILDAKFKNTAVRPSIFEDLLTPELQVRFEENSWKFPGFVLVQRPVRIYPFNAAAHLLGYVAEVSPKQIETSESFYRMGDYVGQTGLESVYERVLMGQRGVQYLIKDNKNRLVGSYEKGEFDTAAIAGRGLRTYIDIELQQLAEKLMNNKVGSVVAIDPKTGGILAMASGPNFNPNELTGPHRNKNYTKLVLDVKAPLLNRAIKGQYPPGSTFKPIDALIALEEGVITPQSGIACSGGYYACSKRVGCLETWAGHAANLRLAIAHSCNSFFCNTYRLIVDNRKYDDVKVGYQKWHDYMNSFGLGIRLGLDLPSEDKGNIPDTARYNREYRGQWNSCTNLTLGIGQDMMTATPLQLANAMCIIANRGYYYTPHFVKNIDDETEEDAAFLKKYREKHEVLTHIPDDAYDAVQDGMHDVVEEGTARIAKIPGINICAKTGTAQNFTILDGRKIELPNNSMFVCFAPKEDPKIAIAVTVENAGFGATWAGPIARIIMEKYLNDSLQTKSKEDLERISNADLMPKYYIRVQYKEDSIRAYEWFKKTKDSSYIKKYVFENLPTPGSNNNKKQKEQNKKQDLVFLNEDRMPRQKQFTHKA